MKTTQFWVLFSVKQGVAHCEPIHEGLRNNLQGLLSGRLADYVPIAVFPDEASATSFLMTLAPKVPALARLNGGQR